MRRRILLADDSVTIQKVIELTFLDEDYEVRAVSNGDEAVAALAQADPDFVIADVHMPGANGYEVCRRSKQRRPGVPVLLLVGTFEPFDEAQARSAGADSFLKKPFDSQELLQRVEELLAASAPAAPAAPAALPLSALEPTPVFSEPPPALSALDAELPPLGGYEPPASFEPAGPGLSEFSAEPSWGNFELEAEPESPPSFTAPAEEPYDREPSFALEPEPSFAPPPEEPVFTMDDDVSTFNLRDEPVSAPEELGLDEPNDPFASQLSEPLPEPAAAPGPAPFSAGFSWSEPVVEPVMETAPAAPQTWELPSPEPAPAPSLSWEEPAPAEPEAWSPMAAAAPVVAAAAVVAEVSPSPVPAPAASNGGGRLGDEDVDRIARRVVELLGDKAVRDIAWEVIPDLAEVIIRARLRELESQVDLQ